MIAYKNVVVLLIVLGVATLSQAALKEKTATDKDAASSNGVSKYMAYGQQGYGLGYVGQGYGIGYGVPDYGASGYYPGLNPGLVPPYYNTYPYGESQQFYRNPYNPLGYGNYPGQLFPTGNYPSIYQGSGFPQQVYPQQGYPVQGYHVQGYPQLSTYKSSVEPSSNPRAATA